MNYYIIPKYKKLIASGPAAQDTLDHFLTSQGDFELPTFLKEYPQATAMQLYLFADYAILSAYTPPERRLISTARVAPTAESRTSLEIEVEKLTLPTIPKTYSYRVTKILSLKCSP